MKQAKKKIVSLMLTVILILTGLLSACGGQTDGSEDMMKPNSAKEELSNTENQNEAAQNAGTGGSEKEETGVSFANFQTVDWQGNEVNESIFSEYDLTMINIWATYCQPCLREMPDLGELSKEYQKQGVQIVGLVLDVFLPDGSVSPEAKEVVGDVIEKTGADYTHLIPSRELIAAELRDVQSVPTTIFVDRYGNRVGDTYIGAKSKEKWQEIIRQTLETVEVQ